MADIISFVGTNDGGRLTSHLRVHGRIVSAKQGNGDGTDDCNFGGCDGGGNDDNEDDNGGGSESDGGAVGSGGGNGKRTCGGTDAMPGGR